MSVGWSPTGILVKPGKSTKVRLRTLGEKISERAGVNRFSLDSARVTRWWLSARETPTEVDRQPRDALVAAGDSQRLVLDLFADLAKVVVPPVGVQELSVLVRDCIADSAWEGELRVCGGRRGRRRRGAEGRRGVDELEDERSAGDDALASREKVPADNPVCDGGQSAYLTGPLVAEKGEADSRLEDRGLSGTLRSAVWVQPVSIQ